MLLITPLIVKITNDLLNILIVTMIFIYRYLPLFDENNNIVSSSVALLFIVHYYSIFLIVSLIPFTFFKHKFNVLILNFFFNYKNFTIYTQHLYSIDDKLSRNRNLS